MIKWIVAILLFVSVFLQQGAAQTHVQTSTFFQYSTATTVSSTFDGPGTSGNLIVVHLDWDGQSQHSISLTDNKGNHYAKIMGPTNWDGTNYGAELWYAYNIIAGGAPITITAELSGAPTSFYQIYASEYSGIISSDPLDKYSVAIGSTAAVSSGSKTTVYSHELIYGASIGSIDYLSPGTGFTARSTDNQNIIEDKYVASAGTYDASFTSAGGNWVAQMATFISTSSVLTVPVQLLSFSGQCNKGYIDLSWSTLSETNNDYFTIERSEDAVNWTVAGTRKSDGNSLTPQNYSFTAEETSSPFTYFRLKQTYLNGDSQYFNSIRVNNCTTELLIYTNPSNGTFYAGRFYSKGSEVYTVTIYDYLGKVVTRQTSSQPEFRISFPQILPAGMYYAWFSSSVFTTTKRFLVTR